MNKEKGNESKESTPRSEEEDKSGRQLKSLSQFEGPESWSNAESSVGSSARKRPSSWDDSDGESPSTTINSSNHNGLIYSERSQKREKSVAEEINDIKTQYFKDLEGVEGLSEPPNFNFEVKTCKNVEDKEEIRSKLDASDRRQSPARIRRRTKSSSSSSAVLEHTVECSSSENKEDFQILTPENYQYKASKYQSYSSENPSVKAELELDSSFFLDHIFTELRTKRIGLVSLGEESSFGKRSREGEMLDLESCSGSNMKLLKSHDLTRTFQSHKYNPDLKTLESFESEEPIAFIHKTSRKLSQILEVEETKKSQEGINLSDEEAGVQLFEMSPFLWANTQKSPDDIMSPFPTSNDGEENMRCWTSIISLRQKPETLTLQPAQLSPKNSGSLEKLREEEKPENHNQGRLSGRFHNLFPHSDSDNDNIIFLTEKTGKTQLGLNSEKQDENNFDSFEDYERVKDVDREQRETMWQISEIENANSESEKVSVGENPGSRGTNNGPSTPQKNSRCDITPNSEIGKNCQGERTSNLLEETLLSWSEGSTPRHSSRKSSKRERESDFLIEMECSNLQPQRLTSRGLQLEEVTPCHSSRESSFRLKDEYIKSTSGETSGRSSQRTRDSLNPETTEDKPNCLNINLEKICSDSSTSTGSNSSSYRTFTQDEIKDPSFRMNSPGQSARSSHTSELSKTESPKKMKNYFPDCSDPNKLRMKGSKTDRDFKPQKISSRSLRSSDGIVGNFERKTESIVSEPLIIREKQTSANSEGRLTTATMKEPLKRNETRPVSINNTNSCSSVVSESTEVTHAELNDVIANLESTRISRQMENYAFCGNVTMTVGNIISEKINSSRSDKTGIKWSNNKSFGRNKEEEEARKGLCQTRSEETVKSEDFKRNLLSIQTTDVIQENPESFKKDGRTERNTVTSGQFSEDVMTIEESETFLGEKSSLSPSSAGVIDKELTIPIKDISSSLEKIETDSDKSDRENERARTEREEKSCRSRRDGKLSNESLSITCESLEQNSLKVKIFPGQRSNRSAISSASSEATEKHIPSNISEPESSRYTRPEESQILNENLKSTSSKTSFQEILGHETPKEFKGASKPIFQDKFNGETWNKLIDAFEGAEKSARSSENRFPGFPSLNQKRFTECDREETQDFFMYEPDELNESEDFFTFSRRLIEAEWKSCLRSPKDREQKGNKCDNLVPESINLPLEHPEGRVILKGNEEESVHEHDSKIRNFEIGEFGDGNLWNDGKHDISEPEKPQHHGDGNQERRNNWETLVLRLEDNKKENEVKGRAHTCKDPEGKGPRPNLPKNKSFSGKENNADFEPIFHSHNLNHSKSDNSLSKMWSPRRANESENFKTLTTTDPMKGTTRREVNEDPDWNSKIGDCREESFYEEREYQLENSYSDDENRLIYEENPEKSFERLNTVSSEMDNRKREKEYTNLSIFLAGQKKEKALVKTNNWLIIKNQEGKQSKQQKEKLRKLKKKLKKCDKLNSSKEPLYIDENAPGRMPAFVPVLKFGNSSCLQNFYKRLFSICCLTSNSSAATSV